MRRAVWKFMARQHVLGSAYSHGIARYMGEAAGLNLDAAPIADEFVPATMPLFGAYGSYQH